MISESVQMSESVDSRELHRLAEEVSEMYPLGPTVALAYQVVLNDCQLHCFNEGTEVKKLGGLHVIGTSLRESRRMDNQPPAENHANPRTCFFHVLFKAAALAFYILSALFVDSFVIIFVIIVLLVALDFWVVKNVSGHILVGLRWWNEINDLGESVWKFESLDQESLARMNKDSWLFWWSLYLSAVAWIIQQIFSLIRFQADYLA